MDQQQTEKWAKNQLKVLLLTLLEDIEADRVTLKKYDHNLVIGPSTYKWELEFINGNISIEMTTP